MSSPMSTLKKKKSPLGSPSGKGPGPKASFRHPDFTEDQIQKLTEVTETLFRLNVDDGTGDSHWNLDDTGCSSQGEKDEAGAVRQTRSKSEGCRSSTSDESLLSIALKRLYQAERQLARTQQGLVEAQHRLRQRDIQIAVLKDKLRMIKRGKKRGYAEFGEKAANLGAGHAELSPSQGYDSGSEVSDHDRSSTEILQGVSDLHGWGINNPSSTMAVDYDVLLHNIADLNTMAGDGTAQVTYTNEGATLKVPEPLPLTFYANGFTLSSGPFRNIADPKSQQFLVDIMDGYFPSELQKAYPEGVPFRVMDKRHMVFPESSHCKVFWGPGKKLSGNNDNYLPVLKKHEETYPAVVSPLKTKKQGTKTAPVERSIRSSSKGAKISLKIKADNGDDIYVVDMASSDTIADLRRCLDSLQTSEKTKDYDIVSSFPCGILADSTACLSDYGLVSNTVLHLRYISHRKQV